MNMEKKEPKDRIKEIRTAFKPSLSQSRFAELIGVSLSTVQKMELGAKPTDSFLDAMELKLNINPAYIVFGKGKQFLNDQKPTIPEEKVPGAINPWKDALVVELKQTADTWKENADTWKQKYEQVFARLEFLMDRLPLGKHRPVNGTALGLRLTGTGQLR